MVHEKFEVCPGSVGSFRTRKLNFSNLQLRKSSEIEAPSDPKKAPKKPLTKKPSKLQKPSFAAEVEKLQSTEKDLKPTPGVLATRHGAKGRLGRNKKNIWQW